MTWDEQVHIVAAWIASNAPMREGQYQDIAAEETQPPARVSSCPYCASTSHLLPKCPAWAADSGTSLLRRQSDEIQALREQLATAHEVVGQSIAAMQEIINCGQYVRTTQGEPRNRYTAAEQNVRSALSAARTWLRKGASK